MNRDDVEKILNNADTLDYGSQSGYECGMINNLIDNIYDDFENIINIEIDKLNNKIHKGFCDDITQDKNYAIFDKISILENIKKNLNAN